MQYSSRSESKQFNDMYLKQRGSFFVIVLAPFHANRTKNRVKRSFNLIGQPKMNLINSESIRNVSLRIWHTYVFFKSKHAKFVEKR